MINAELLSPAGDLECVDTAIRYGADAVYAGGSLLQLRASAVAFSGDDVVEAARRVHSAKKKLYITVNSFAKNEELVPLGEYARFLYGAGVDAAIVSDLGVLAVIKRAEPRLPVHISTQASCLNYEAARVYYELGASRVVLGREATLPEIEVIRENAPPQLELEAFVHGAMCMSYSGRCLISAYLNNRSGNRGECTQPCRWEYYLMEQKRPGEFFEVEQDGGHTAILSSHDMKMISHLEQLQRAGIVSFKIEGRMKTPYYVATVTNAYKCAMMGTASLSELERELEAVSHRPYSTGFYFGNEVYNSFNDGFYHFDCSFAGVALSDCSGGELTLMQRNNFRVGDTLEVLSPGKIGVPFTVEYIIDDSGERVDSAPHPKQIVSINCPVQVCKDDIIRKRLKV